MNENFWWDGLTGEEKKIAMEAVAAFQAKKLKEERIETLTNQIYNSIDALHNLMNVCEWENFMEDFRQDLRDQYI